MTGKQTRARVSALRAAQRDADRMVRRAATRDEAEDWSAVWHLIDDERGTLRPAWQRKLRGGSQ